MLYFLFMKQLPILFHIVLSMCVRISSLGGSVVLAAMVYIYLDIR